MTDIKKLAQKLIDKGIDPYDSRSVSRVSDAIDDEFKLIMQVLDAMIEIEQESREVKTKAEYLEKIGEV